MTFDVEKAKKDGRCFYCGEEVEFIAGPDVQEICIFKAKGKFGSTYVQYLKNIPTKKTGWINIYPSSFGRLTSYEIYTSKKEADRYADQDRIACIQIEWEE